MVLISLVYELFTLTDKTLAFSGTNVVAVFSKSCWRNHQTCRTQEEYSQTAQTVFCRSFKSNNFDVQFSKVPSELNYPERVFKVPRLPAYSCSSTVPIATIQIKNKAVHPMPPSDKPQAASSTHFWHINPFKENSLMRNFRLWTCNTTQGAEDALITQSREFSKEQSDSSRYCDGLRLNRGWRKRISFEFLLYHRLHLYRYKPQCFMHLIHLLSNKCTGQKIVFSTFQGTV